MLPKGGEGLLALTLCDFLNILPSPCTLIFLFGEDKKEFEAEEGGSILLQVMLSQILKKKE